MNSIIDIPDQYQPAIEDLPGDLQRIAEYIEAHRPGRGVEDTLFMAQVFRGQNLYMRNIDYLVRKIRNDAIKKAYDGGEKIRDLALKWKLSSRMVEKILATPDDPEKNQLKLFPETVS